MGKYATQYRKSWEFLDEFKGWIRRVNGKSNSAWCQYCSKLLTANKAALLEHRTSRDHIKADSTLHQRNSSTMASLRKDSDKIIKIEALDFVEEGKDFQTLQINDSETMQDAPLKVTSANEKGGSKIKVGILTISDRCFVGETEDISGVALRNLVDSCALFKGEVVDQKCSPDDKECIQEVLMDWCDDENIDLAITTGGTGVAVRDVTPEAVKEIIDKEVPGMELQMVSESLKVTLLAMLSRPVCGFRRNTLIITLPGSAKGSQECLRYVAPAITHALDLINDQKSKVESVHSLLQKRSMEVEVVLDDLSKEEEADASENDNTVISKAQIPKVARRHRHSPYPLITVDQAQAKVLSKAFQLASEAIKATDSLGYSLFEDVYAKEPIPPFPASVKDGYAVLATDGIGTRRVIGNSCAGVEPQLQEVSSGTCMRVNTGAPIPPGADAVIQVEDTKVAIESDDGSEEIEIEILKPPSEGQDIRPKGCDISMGELLFTQGQIIGPAEIGVMVSAGVMEILAHKKPVVAVLSTGNELQSPFETSLREGHIYDSNKVTLLSLLQQHSIPAFDAGIAKDDPTSLLRFIRRALRKADILVSSGGVSMGEKDLLRPILTTDLKAKLHFAQVFMKPGKPTTFATCTFAGRPKLILGLPGNPVSAIVTAHLYLLPLCRKMSGYSDYHNTIVRAKLASKLRLDPRPEYHRVTLSWSSADNLPMAHSTGKQMSSRLMSMASAQALLQLPPSTKETTSLPAGSVVEAIVLSL